MAAYSASAAEATTTGMPAQNTKRGLLGQWSGLGEAGSTRGIGPRK
jgi:hypothetical protein